MPSEKQIEAAKKALGPLRDTYVDRDDIIKIITAAEQVEPAPTYDAPLGAIENGRVFLQRLVDRYDFQCEAGGLANCSDYHEVVRCFEAMAEWIYHHAPAARSGAVKVKAILELVQYHVTDDDDRASLTTAISALEPAEPATNVEPVATVYRKGNVIGQLVWTKAGERADLPDGTKLFTRPPEPATDAEPVAWLYDWVDDDGETQTEASTNRISSVNFKPTSNVRPLFTRPPESRLREALYAMMKEFRQADLPYGSKAYQLALETLAQEDGR